MIKDLNIKLFILTGFVLLFILSCENVITENSTELKQSVAQDTRSLYFPYNTIDTVNNYIYKDSFLNETFSKYLFAMKEPLIYDRDYAKTVFRLTLISTFKKPIAIRIEKEGEKYSVCYKETDGTGGYTAGNLITDSCKLLNKESWKHFLFLLDNCNFWNMQTKKEDVIGIDGSYWILEGASDNEYKMVCRWSPEKNDAYTVCCEYLLTLLDLRKISKSDFENTYDFYLALLNSTQKNSKKFKDLTLLFSESIIDTIWKKNTLFLNLESDYGLELKINKKTKLIDIDYERLEYDTVILFKYYHQNTNTIKDEY